VLGSHSLLWALDPLREALEGGVTLLCEAGDDRARISAQVELLEPERRPQLITSTDELASDQRFDWIGGRLGSADLEAFDWQQLASVLDRHGHRRTGLRLLISRAETGPAGALTSQNPEARELKALVAREQQWLERLQPQTGFLEAMGWQLQSQRWQETIAMAGGKTLVERWLQEGSPYRTMLGEQSTSSLKQLRQLLEQQGGEAMALPLQHQLLSGSRPGP